MKKVIWNSYLFVLYPLLYIYANSYEDVSFIDTIIPIIVGLSITFFLVLFLRKWTTWEKASIIVSIFWILFFSYSVTHDLIIEVGMSTQIIRHRYLSLLWLFIQCGAIYYVLCSKHSFVRVSKALTLMGCYLNCYALFQISNAAITYQYEFNDNNEVSDQYALLSKSQFPDIFYIVLDEFASKEQAKSFYNYDITPFEQFLTLKGFYIASESKSKYALTKLSLATSLNMEYPKENTDIYQAVRQNKVVSYLKTKDYKYIHIGPLFKYTKFNQFSDVSYNPFIVGNHFITEILMNSFLKALYEPWTVDRKFILTTFYALEQSVNYQSPKFVFAHIMCPHAPFVFKDNGDSLPYADASNWKDKSVYLGQYIFVMRSIEKIINVILEQNRTPPVIIIQSDHGVRVDPNESNAHKIFNAYYIPNGRMQQLTQDINPINTFRVVFNYYFNAKMPLIPNSIGTQ